jgi:hypothetical protein
MCVLRNFSDILKVLNKLVFALLLLLRAGQAYTQGQDGA